MADARAYPKVGTVVDHLPVRPGLLGDFVGGVWGPAEAGGTRADVSPADTSDVLGRFADSTAADAVRAVDAARTLPFVDPDRIAVTGGSQGGGIALAAGAPAGVQAVLPDVAFLCAYRRGTDVAIGGPFQELATYLSVHRDEVDAAFRTLSYLDGVNFARRIHAPSLFSVALMDTIVPPSTTFAAYNHLAAADRAIEVYPFNGHEGGQAAHWHKQAAWLAERI